MTNRLSHSSVRMYSECGRKYDLHYNKKLRSKTTSGALLFGSAIDQALNHLLKTKNLPESIELFDLSFTDNYINKKPEYLPHSMLVTYAESDFDIELLLPEDIAQYGKFRNITGSLEDIEKDYKYLMEKKGKEGFNALQDFEKQYLNLANWLCLRRKGHIMLETYNKEIIPQIKEVLTVQKESIITNESGDSIVMYLDFIVELHDGTRWLLDNKTSTRQYDKDSPMKSQQLILYYHSEKEEYNLTGVGFVVMYKLIQKNRVKICSKCNYDGSGERHKTCPALLASIDGKKAPRCNGNWNETITPKARIEMILNRVSTQAESLVIETFDAANEGIKKEAFGPNLGACGTPGTGFVCPFYKRCWMGSDEDLVKM